MIDVKPPEYETTDILNPVDLNTPGYKQSDDSIWAHCSDMLKFKLLFDDIGVEYEIIGNEIEIKPNHFDGKDGLIIKFYDENQQFKEFDDISPRDKALHEINKTLKEIHREMRKRKT